MEATGPRTTTLNDLPLDVTTDQLLPSMELKDLLRLRAINKEWNQRVLRFLHTHWLPERWKKLDVIVNEITSKYPHILYENLAQIIKSANPAQTRRDTHDLQLKLIEALKIASIMLKVMEALFPQNPLQVSTGSVTIQNLRDLKQQFEQQKQQTVTILRRMGPENESEMELSMYEIEHMAKGGRRKEMTKGQERLILEKIEQVLQAREHQSNARRSTLNTHQEGMARRRANMLSAAKRRYQGKGVTFQQVLDTVGR